MISDKDNVIYSLEKSVNELEKIINNSIENKIENFNDVYSCLGNTLFWIGASLDRLKRNGEKESEYEFAFRGAYNAQKHSIKLISFQCYEKGGISFPFSSPFTIPAPRYCFEKLEENIIKCGNEIQAYNKCLYKKDIIPEIKKIQEIIQEKMSKY